MGDEWVVRAEWQSRKLAAAIIKGQWEWYDRAPVMMVRQQWPCCFNVASGKKGCCMLGGIQRLGVACRCNLKRSRRFKIKATLCVVSQFNVSKRGLVTNYYCNTWNALALCYSCSLCFEVLLHGWLSWLLVANIAGNFSRLLQTYQTWQFHQESSPCKVLKCVCDVYDQKNSQKKADQK